MPSTYHQIFYHIVFTTKLRQQFLKPPHDTQLYAYTAGILKNLQVTPHAINGTTDHIHILAQFTPSQTPADVIRELKKATSTFLKPHIPQFAWQEGYGIFSVSKSELPKLKAYIARQKDHHRTSSTEDELAILLNG